MTKKDYELIAREIKGGTVYHNEAFINKNSFVHSLAQRLQEDNPRFDYKKFAEACGCEVSE